MRSEYVAVIGLLGLSCCIFHAHGQDIIFPGETERPSRFPFNPGQGRPTNPPPDNSDDQNNQDDKNNSNGQNGVNQEKYRNCVSNCRLTSIQAFMQYKPVCGSDGVTYPNLETFDCAVKCGNPIQNVGSGECTTGATSTTTTTTTPSSVTTTSTPVPNNPNGLNSGITQQQYNNCIDNCRFTSEYNPQCGSDGVTYQNHGALNCAFNCGKGIQNLGRAPCDQYSNTTPASG